MGLLQFEHAAHYSYTLLMVYIRVYNYIMCMYVRTCVRVCVGACRLPMPTCACAHKMCEWVRICACVHACVGVCMDIRGNARRNAVLHTKQK